MDTTEIIPSAGLSGRSRADLKAALESGQFRMYVQFIYDLRGKSFLGVEALSRWIHPEKGLILPSLYIDELHTCGLISLLDYQMLENSCRLLETWSGTELGTLRVCCNFTRITLGAPDFLARFTEIVDRHRFDRSRLVIEMTEDSVVDDKDVLIRNILACKSAGFRVSLDDLGAGYTSFNDLCDFPVDVIKVDCELTRKITTPRGKSFLLELANLAHNLGIRVLCEGVETEQLRAAVREIGCDYVQGYYYSRAVPAEDAAEEYRKVQARAREIM